MPRGITLNDYERGKIQGFKESGLSNRQIAKEINRSHNVINNYLKDPSNYGLKFHSGRKQILTPRVKRQIMKDISNTSMSINKIIDNNGIQASKSTVWRAVNSNPNIQSSCKKKKPNLTSKHKLARLTWAEKYFSWKVEWDRVIFSDEKKFNLDGPDGYRFYWHDLRKDPVFFSKRHSGGGSVMVWAGFGRHGKTNISILHGKCKSIDYIKQLESNLLTCASNIGGIHWVFQQDNAPIHTSKETKTWFFNKNIKVLDWPALSPDLNPMENLWGILTRKIYANGKQYGNINDLKTAIIKEWNDINVGTLDNLVDSMPSRIFQLTKAHGQSINY